MRIMMKVNIPTATANAAVKAGTFGPTIQKFMDAAKPEAAYFVEEDGERTGMFFLQMNDSSEMPSLAEPWFLAFEAKVTFRPVMTPADLAAAGPGFAQAIKEYT